MGIASSSSLDLGLLVEEASEWLEYTHNRVSGEAAAARRPRSEAELGMG